MPVVTMTPEAVAQYTCEPGKRMTIYYDAALKNELLFRVMQNGHAHLDCRRP